MDTKSQDPANDRALMERAVALFRQCESEPGPCLRFETAKLRADSQGVHIFDRTSGLNVLLDEVMAPEEAWASAPRYVSIALTNACELHCPFCYAPKTSARLGTEQVLAWVRELAAAGCLGVGFGGGEPTAHPQFVEICARAAADTDLAITLTTHGHRFTEALAKDVRGSVHFIRVSVDAVGAQYEQIRGRSFDVLRERLATIATVSPFGINMVVSDDTLRALDAVAAFAAGSDAVELLLIPQQPTAHVPALSATGKRMLAAWIREYRGSLRLAISRAGTPDGIPLADPFQLEDPLIAHVHVDAAGWLRPNAYSELAVEVNNSVLSALDELRSRRK
jgi:MoaA/NifB/PqqE/SkfB family radical SAM enzyme